MAENREGGGTRGGGKPKESLGYRILMVILWADVAVTLGFVVFLAGSCG